MSPTSKASVSGSRSPPNVPVKEEVSETLSFTTSRRQSSPYRLPLAEMGRTGYPDYKWPQWTRPDETMLDNLYTPTQIMLPPITAFRQENDSTTGARHLQSLSDIYFTQLCDLNGPCHM
ncbi:hypothetical protein BFJ63_vAg17892 [Fusarium oxysporum f. sp. narcissi]|nr:hypothetical protein BFJ63_vAg17892 [Fusarium oxysporum f. sp. narcissi]